MEHLMYCMKGEPLRHGKFNGLRERLDFWGCFHTTYCDEDGDDADDDKDDDDDRDDDGNGDDDGYKINTK